MRKLCFLTMLCLIWASPAHGAAPAQPETVVLDELELSAPKDTTDRITQTEIERKSASNLWQALRGVTGVYQTYGDMRSEGAIAIRGSSRYQVGMYVDGVPTATAYRNEWDYNNTMSFDLESIEVSKGYSSPLLQSSNGLAGVVNVRTAKPKKEFEFTTKYMNFFDRKLDDQGRSFGLSIGTRQDLFYVQSQVMHDEQDFFTLSKDFEAGTYENGGRRGNSDYQNRRVNIIAGITPTDNIDIMFGFVRQEFEKGQPLNAAANQPVLGSSGSRTRAWRWPTYETDRYYMNADIALSDKADIKFVAYYDKHIDASDDYADPNFNNVASYSRHQEYDQYTAGGQIIFSYAFNDANKLAASAGYRRLSHKEHRYPSTYGVDWSFWEHDVEDYYDLGAEYTLKPIDPLTLVFGASYTRLEPVTAKLRSAAGSPMVSLRDKDDIRQDLFNYQLGVFYDLTKDHELFFTFAKKARPATMRERYMRVSGAPANPDIDPEHVYHFELGYRGLVDNWLKLNASTYFSHYTDKIQGLRDAGNNTYYDNVDKADVYGLELGAEALLTSFLSVGATASFMDWETDTDIRAQENLTDAPKAVGTIYAVIAPLDGLAIIPEVYMTSAFYNSANPDANNNESPGFATFNLKATYDVNQNLMFEAGVKNLLDKNYYYNYGFPHAGRSYFAGVTYKF